MLTGGALGASENSNRRVSMANAVTVCKKCTTKQLVKVVYHPILHLDRNKKHKAHFEYVKCFNFVRASPHVAITDTSNLVPPN